MCIKLIDNRKQDFKNKENNVKYNNFINKLINNFNKKFKYNKNSGFCANYKK